MTIKSAKLALVMTALLLGSNFAMAETDLVDQAKASALEFCANDSSLTTEAERAKCAEDVNEWFSNPDNEADLVIYFVLPEALADALTAEILTNALNEVFADVLTEVFADVLTEVFAGSVTTTVSTPSRGCYRYHHNSLKPENI